ncbi:hypothetical protein I1A62_02460 (plasmid) [Rhodococcus sp. USK10]|uniref:hypothetical protein n=1 Tax=Rhodococcus sp. USK10 TaxID=2789739 RepID=UPI001C5EDEF6|nr:hypothetical protein [Rhodococcus sp. USK10]QYB00004.1 hypothetical protein I1A62_02460 [Rhodococcus sp. USK10]
MKQLPVQPVLSDGAIRHPADLGVVCAFIGCDGPVFEVAVLLETLPIRDDVVEISFASIVVGMSLCGVEYPSQEDGLVLREHDLAQQHGGYLYLFDRWTRVSYP